MLSRRRFSEALLVGGACALLRQRDLRAAASRELFRIVRSKNANVVKYAVRLAPDGSLDRAAPVEAYWQMLAEGGQREELSWTERRLAYGFSLRNVRSDGCSLQLIACPKRELEILRVGEEFRAHTWIRSRPCFLTRIFVRASDGALLPRVEYVELAGLTHDGLHVLERLTP